MSVRGGLLDLHVGGGTNSTLVNFEDRFVPAAVSGACRSLDSSRSVLVSFATPGNSLPRPRTARSSESLHAGSSLEAPRTLTSLGSRSMFAGT